LNDDGSFAWAKGSKDASAPKTLAGKLSQEQMKALVEKIQAAREDTSPKDADYIAFEFINSDGQFERKDYSTPGDEPAASLLAMVDELARKNGEATRRLASMTYTLGHGREMLRSFSLNEDGGFAWVMAGRLSPQTLAGKLGEEDVKSLIKKIQSAQRSAGAGPVHFEFVNADGKLEQKDYSTPSAEPAAALVATIDELAHRNGKPQAATQPATSPATNVAGTNPATSPAEVSQDDALKIAEETLRKRGTDPSAMAYYGTSSFTDPNGKKFCRVSWGPKQPPQVEGRPRARITGGQVIVLVSVDTGETKIIFGR